MLPQLARDNERARRLAEELAAVGVDVDVQSVETNIVMCRLNVDALSRAGVLGYPYREDRIRLVTHRHVGDETIERVVAAASLALP